MTRAGPDQPAAKNSPPTPVAVAAEYDRPRYSNGKTETQPGGDTSYNALHMMNAGPGSQTPRL